MKKFYISLYLIVLISLLLWRGVGGEAFAQQCDPSVPVFNVDLTGSAGGSWTSPSSGRNGLCCSASGSDRCIEFDITLDSGAAGIRFDITSGAVPGGSLFYQVDCGPPAPVGGFICLNGVGPHHLTFCKPGGNSNTFQVTSIPKPSVNGTHIISQACTGLLVAKGLVDTSITWTSIPSNPVYNGYLSCTHGCDSSIVTFTGGVMPAYVDYQVCGDVAGGCNAITFCDTIRVNFVNDLAVNILPKNPVICFGGSFATVTAQPSGGLAPYTYLWSNGATSQSISVGVGTFMVTLTDAFHCSTTYDSVTVTAFLSAITANAGSDQTLCLGARQSVTLNGGITAATGGIWTGGSGTYNPDDTTLNATYTPSASEITAGYAQLILTTTGNGGCQPDSDMIRINIAPQPSPQETGTFTVCEHTSAIYTAADTTPVSYLWLVTGGTLLSPNNANPVTVLWPSAGSGSITLTASNAYCDTTIVYPVTINPKPTPVITVSPSSVCVPAITVYSLNNPGANTISWAVTGGTIIGSATDSILTVQWTTTGTATVSVTETNSFGCDSTVSVSVALNPQPDPQITGSLVSCENSVATYTVTCNVPVAYHWTVAGGTLLSSNSNSIVNVQWNNAGIGTITLTATHAGGCDSTIAFPVTINPKPLPAITGPASVCIPASSVFSVNASGNNYSWSVAGGTIIGSASGNSITVQWNSVGTAQVTVIETNIFGCDSTVTVPVTISPFPNPVLFGKNKVCVQDTANYWVPNVQGHTYNWKVIGGSIISFTVTNSIDVYWYIPGQGEVSVQEMSSSGCDSTVKQAVMVNPKPAPVVTGPLGVCENQRFYYLTQNNGSYFNWLANGGYIVNTSTADDSANIQWTSAGTGTITLMEIDGNGCVNSTNVSVIVQPKPHPAIAGNHTGCVSQLQNNYLANAQPGVNYLWTTNGGVITNGNGTGNISILWTTPGTFTITVTATNLSTGCDSSATIQVKVDTMPKPSITASGYNGCAPLGVYFNCNPQNPNYSYSWSFGDGHSSWGVNPSHQFNNPGTFPVTLIVSNNTGCKDSISSQVTAFPSPIAYFSEHITSDVYYNTTPFTLQNLSKGASQYFWTFGDGDSSYDFEPTYQYAEPGKYTITLIVTNMYGCMDTTQQTLEIKVPEDLYIPNAFSPNGDFHNDLFNISAKNIKDLNIEIFDRWGEEIFNSKDKDFIWDGTFKGALVQGGVYVYKLKATGEYGKQFDRTGTVTVLR